MKQGPNPNIDIDKLSARIKELGDKSTQILLFLSFAFVAVVTLKSDHTNSGSQQHALTIALRWWVIALLPIILGIAPLKEFVKTESGPYTIIANVKVGLLWIAIVFILAGAIYFRCGIWPIAQ